MIRKPLFSGSSSIIYVFDTNVFSQIIANYFVDSFPTFWQKFDAKVMAGEITSTKEVRRELEIRFSSWPSKYPQLFQNPTAEVGAFVSKIYQISHFQHNIEVQKLLIGGNVADPFVIATAAANNGTVVTNEKLKPNSAKIPNICAHFSIPCIQLSDFFLQEKWIF